MDFEIILQNLLEKAIKCFNTGDYSALNELIVENIQFTAPAYDNDVIQEDAVHLNKKEDVFHYWKRLHASYPFKIDEFKFLEIGKTSSFRNTMRGIHYIIDAEVHFDEYGKVKSIYNKIWDTI